MFNKNIVQIFIPLISILILTLFCGQSLCGYQSSQSGGSSKSNSKQDNYGNYEFNYEITDPLGAKNYRFERGDTNSNVEGSYGLQDTDGRMRVVDYWADKQNGFRAKIRSNEPGVGNQDAADAIYNGPDSKGGFSDGQSISHSSFGGSGKFTSFDNRGSSKNNW